MAIEMQKWERVLTLNKIRKGTSGALGMFYAFIRAVVKLVMHRQKCIKFILMTQLVALNKLCINKKGKINQAKVIGKYLTKTMTSYIGKFFVYTNQRDQ